MSVMHSKQEQQAAEAEHGRERAQIGLGRLDRLKEDRSGRMGRILVVPTDTPPAKDIQHKSRESHEQEQESDQ